MLIETRIGPGDWLVTYLANGVQASNVGKTLGTSWVIEPPTGRCNRRRNMTKIQDTFKDLLKRTVAPRLRACGLTGSGQNYSLKSDTHWALVGLQKSRFSTADSLKFTINLYVVPKAEWESARRQRSYLPAKPSANVHWPVGWVMRIGHLLPGSQDQWWPVDEATDLDQLADEVVDAIRSKAMPAMLAQIKSARAGGSATDP